MRTKREPSGIFATRFSFPIARPVTVILCFTALSTKTEGFFGLFYYFFLVPVVVCDLPRPFSLRHEKDISSSATLSIASSANSTLPSLMSFLDRSKCERMAFRSFSKVIAWSSPFLISSKTLIFSRHPKRHPVASAP